MTIMVRPRTRDQNSYLPVSAHALEHKISNLEVCYNLKGIYKLEEHPYPEFNVPNY